MLDEHVQGPQCDDTKQYCATSKKGTVKKFIMVFQSKKLARNYFVNFGISLVFSTFPIDLKAEEFWFQR